MKMGKGHNFVFNVNLGTIRQGMHVHLHYIHGYHT